MTLYILSRDEISVRVSWRLRTSAMRLPRPIPSMTRPKLILYLVLLVFGALLFYYLHLQKVFTQDRTTGTLTGVATTLLIISLTELIPESANWVGTISRENKFKKLFGVQAVREDIRFVFPQRSIDRGVVREDPFKTYYVTPIMRGRRPEPEGVVSWLAFQDVRAATYLSNTFGDMTRRKITVLHDRDIDINSETHKAHCLISFGLGFTKLTHDIAGYFNDQLFKVLWREVDGRQNRVTDYFTIGGSNASPDAMRGKDIAIVARVVLAPSSRSEPQGVWFVCAGRTAPGTAAAGFFLAEKWEEILSIYKKSKKDLSKDSVAIVLQHTVMNSQEQGGYPCEYDSTVEVLRESGEPILAWKRATGL